MLQKISDLSFKAYWAARNFASDLKKDERGLEVVQVVLIVLVGVLLVGILWGFLSGWIGELWERITGAADGIG